MRDDDSIDVERQDGLQGLRERGAVAEEDPLQEARGSEPVEDTVDAHEHAEETSRRFLAEVEAEVVDDQGSAGDVMKRY